MTTLCGLKINRFLLFFDQKNEPRRSPNRALGGLEGRFGEELVLDGRSSMYGRLPYIDERPKVVKKIGFWRSKSDIKTLFFEHLIFVGK